MARNAVRSVGREYAVLRRDDVAMAMQRRHTDVANAKAWNQRVSTAYLSLRKDDQPLSEKYESLSGEDPRYNQLMRRRGYVVDRAPRSDGARHTCIGVARIHSLFSARTVSALGAIAAAHVTAMGSATLSRGGTATATPDTSSSR